MTETMDQKVNRLVERFNEEMGSEKAAIRLLAAARAWYEARSANITDRRLIAAELELYDATSEVVRISRQAAMVAAEWAKYGNEE